MRNKTIKVFAIMTSLACGTALQAATRYWSNAGGDSRWSNSANWTSSLKPSSNDVVYLANNCSDEPQNIILDEDAWLSQIDCRATGNRHYTITPENDAFMRLNSIVGSSSRTVDLTINADIRVALEYLRVRAYGGTTTLNGRVFPSPGERESMYLIAHYDNPLALGGSNTFTHVMCQDNANIVVKNPHALGQGYVRTTDCSVRGLLTLQTNVVVKGSL